MDLSFFDAFDLHELFYKLWQQVQLVLLSTSCAAAIGVPLGMLLARKPRLSRLILSCASIIQTIPSLALLAFLLPIVGIGTRPALIALTLYALLPILRNSVIAIQTIPESLFETSRSLGLSKWRQFYLLELPLSLPLVIGAIRIAGVMNIATATLAAFIGAGGLGDFINQGLALGNTKLLLLGAIPAALLAIAFDSILGCVQAVFQVPPLKVCWWNSPRFKKILLASGLLFLFFLLAMAFTVQHHKTEALTFRIGTKNFTEQLILGEIVAQLVEEKTTIPVLRKFNLGSTQVCQTALASGEIDLYPEYTGSAYLIVLEGKDKMPSQKLYQYVSEVYANRFNIVWLPMLGFNNTEALAVRSGDLRMENIATISDLSRISSSLRLGSPSEFIGRPDGIPGLEKAYRLSFFDIVEMDPGLMYKALQTSHVDVISAFSTDGRILSYDLRLLADDLQFFPSYDACLLVKEEALALFPELWPLLQKLSGTISDLEIQMLNREVDEGKKLPSAVAKEFLKKKGLL